MCEVVAMLITLMQSLPIGYIYQNITVNPVHVSNYDLTIKNNIHKEEQSKMQTILWTIILV